MTEIYQACHVVCYSGCYVNYGKCLALLDRVLLGARTSCGTIDAITKCFEDVQMKTLCQVVVKDIAVSSPKHLTQVSNKY